MVRAPVLAVWWALWAVPAVGQEGMPPVEITPVAHSGDPAPGIPGAELFYILPPLIDGAGNVLFLAVLVGPGIDASNNIAVFYGPPGEVDLVAWQGAPAPDMGGQVIIKSLLTSNEILSETGVMAMWPRLGGPGIVSGVNDQVTFMGPPNDLRKVLQAGDPAPGLPEGVLVAGGTGAQLDTRISDNGLTLWVNGYLTGPGVDETNDRAIWIGPRDDLKLIWREGMDAPGVPGGAKFAWADFFPFNDAGQAAFRGLLVHSAGIDDSNDCGIWWGTPGNLTLVMREGDPAPGFWPGVTFRTAGATVTPFNSHGDVGDSVKVQGPGISEDNDGVHYVGEPGKLQIWRREGDPAPEAGADVELEYVGAAWLNARREMFCTAKYRGPSIDATNAWAGYFGPYHNCRLTLRDGAPAPHFPPETALCSVAFAYSHWTMNDVGDAITTVELTGPGVTEENKVVLLRRHAALESWVPLIRSGNVIDGRVVFAEYPPDIGGGYQNSTGGSDGTYQGLNDNGQLALRLEFTDGTHGVFRIEPPVFGDADADGDVDVDDWAAIQACMTGAGVDASPDGCELFDFDWDGDVDLKDCAAFQRLLNGGLAD